VTAAPEPVASQGSRRRSPSLRIVLVAVVVVTVGVAGDAWALRAPRRSGPLPTIAIQSPVQTTLAWFSAVNHRNMPLALAHFVPVDRHAMEWSSWGPPFRHVRCELVTETATSAGVGCWFDAITDPEAGMSGDSGWGVDLQREPSGRWLITDYGQG
jgi:hypothetical protein